MTVERPPILNAEPENQDEDTPVQEACSPLTFVGLFWALVIEGSFIGILVGIWALWTYWPF